MTEKTNTETAAEVSEVKRGRKAILIEDIAAMDIDAIDEARVAYAVKLYGENVTADPVRFGMVIAHNKFATSFRESKEYKIAHAAKVEAARKLEESKRANKIMLDKAQEKLAALSAEELAALLAKLS